jgi:hypothetical protein
VPDGFFATAYGFPGIIRFWKKNETLDKGFRFSFNHAIFIILKFVKEGIEIFFKNIYDGN